MKKDVSIQIVRICAMILIILCHLVQELNNSKIAMLAQFFNVGVFIFLFLSGYLYGNKEIKDKWKWLKDRFIKLMTPIYIFLIIFFIIQLFYGYFELKYIFIYSLNLQYFLGTTTGIGHLWFMTAITLCYLITPSLQKLKEKNRFTLLIVCELTIAVISSLIYKKIGQMIFYILAYICGYEYKNIEKKLKLSNILIIIFIFLSIIIRVLSKIKFDSTILYDVIIVSLSQLIIAFGIFYLIQKLCKKFQIKGGKIINHLDNISFPIYITHYMFMVGPIRLMSFSNNILINILLTIISSYILANLLNVISKKIIKILKDKSTTRV